MSAAAAMATSCVIVFLSDAIKDLHQAPFEIDIGGEEPLLMGLTDLSAEGANTSFQLHLRVNPKPSPIVITRHKWLLHWG